MSDVVSPTQTPLAVQLLALGAAVGLGAIIMKYFTHSEEKSEHKKKKVTFEEEVEKQDELREIVEKAVKDAIGSMFESESKSNKKGKPIPVFGKDRDNKQRRRLSESEEPIYKICFTGGPCAGKTTTMSMLMNHVEQHGFRPFLVPEAATILMKAGFLINNTKFGEIEAITFQSCLMRLQVFLEDLTLEYAANNSKSPVVIFCDRGLMDGKAYVSEGVWQAILDEMNWNEVYLRDSRYDAVLHMVTAADGAEKYYDLDTNEARYEGVELAKTVDKKLQKNWSGHSQLHIITNEVPSFDEKVQKAVRIVLNLLGVPQTTIFNCKFLLFPVDITKINVPFQEFEVEEVFLKCPPNQQAKLIKKGFSYSFNYTLETKDFLDDQVMTRRRLISSREYLFYITERKDDTKINLLKKRISFMYKNQHFIVDTFISIEGEPSVLRVETEKKSVDVEKPEFLKYFRDVTDEKEYSTFNMADADYRMPKKDYEATTGLLQQEKKQYVTAPVKEDLEKK